MSNVTFVSTECASSGRLVETFLSVCALTVLCGLVLVAVSRLLLQKTSTSPGGAAEGGHFHCAGKVSSQKSSVWMWSLWVLIEGRLVEKFEFAVLEVQLYFTFPLNSQLTVYSLQICDLLMIYGSVEKKEISGTGLGGLFGRGFRISVWKLLSNSPLFNTDHLNLQIIDVEICKIHCFLGNIGIYTWDTCWCCRC